MLRALGRHWELKLLSLVAAIALWSWVVGGEKMQVTVRAPLEYVGLPDDLVVVVTPPDAVEVSLDVPRWATGRVTSESVRVRVDLSAMREGETLTRLTPADVRVVAGVAVTRMVPAQIRVGLAAAASGVVRIVPRLRGAPAAGHAVRRVRVDPPTVQVRGPRSTIEKQTAVETAPVDVSGGTGPVVQTVGLVLPAFVYATKERSVQVRVDIEPEGRMRESKP